MSAIYGELYRETPLMKGLRDVSLLKGKCGVCEFRVVCSGSRARAYAMTGDPYGPEEACAYEPKGGPGNNVA